MPTFYPAGAPKRASASRALGTKSKRHTIAYLLDSQAVQWGSVLTTRRAPISGIVYLLESDGCYKIGSTSRPTARFRRFQTLLPFACHQRHIIRTTDIQAVERFFLARFKTKRLRGEWFRLGEEEVAFFCRFWEMSAVREVVR